MWALPEDFVSKPGSQTGLSSTSQHQTVFTPSAAPPIQPQQGVRGHWCSFSYWKKRRHSCRPHCFGREDGQRHHYKTTMQASVGLCDFPDGLRQKLASRVNLSPQRPLPCLKPQQEYAGLETPSSSSTDNTTLAEHSTLEAKRRLKECDLPKPICSTNFRVVGG